MKILQDTEVEELGAGEALGVFGDLRRERLRVERDILVLAAHFADLYNVDSADLDGPALPGTERPVQVAGDGAPLVREFAFAEMAAELGITSFSARRLAGDALELRHRLPRLWARVEACEVAGWLARKVAQATRHLTPAQAAAVDDALAPVADGRLSYRQFEDNLTAAVIAADPEAAAERERRAAEEEFAKVGQSNQHGRKTLYVKTSAAEMTRIDATLAYLADGLQQLGDRDPLDRRRAKAMLLLANPTEALRLLQALATANNHPTGHTGHAQDEPAGPAQPGHGQDGQDEPAESTGAAGSTGSAGPPSGTRGSGYHPDDQPLPDPDDTDSPADAVHAEEPAAGNPAQPGTDPDGSLSDPGDPDPGPDDPGAPPGGLASHGPAAGYARPFHPADVPPCSCRGGTYTLDYRRLLPTVNLYIHLDGSHRTTPDTSTPATGETSAPGTGVTGAPGTSAPGTSAPGTSAPGAGVSGVVSVADVGPVARWEGEGPITSHYVRDLLGPHANFVIKPVYDLAQMAPTAAYEVRGRLREAVHLRNPVDVFPYASNDTRTVQIDHSIPHQTPDDTGDDTGDEVTETGVTGGSQPQTRLGNLGPLTRYHHRVKTHAGWRLAQPFDGIYLWKSPHGSIFLVDHTGTRQLRRPTGTPMDAPVGAPAPGDPATSHPGPVRSALADHFWHLLNTAA